LGRDRLAELARQQLAALLQGRGELLRGDPGLPDLSHRALGHRADRVTDAPDREAEDKEAEEHEDYDFRGATPQLLEHSFVPFSCCRRSMYRGMRHPTRWCCE